MGPYIISYNSGRGSKSPVVNCNECEDPIAFEVGEIEKNQKGNVKIRIENSNPPKTAMYLLLLRQIQIN